MGIVSVLSALANDDRLAIVASLRLRARPSSIGEIARDAGLTRFAASRHLRILRGAGLVGVERSRQKHLHFLRPSGFEAVEDWLLEYVPLEPSPSVPR